MIEDIMSELEITNSMVFEELPDCRICNLDKDKVLIICEITDLDQIDRVVKRLPSLRNKMMNQMNNERNMEPVENDKIPISKFLWDMYIVALHQIKNDNDKFKTVDMARYERDRFVARKIIIQYEHFEELKRKSIQLLFPERILDSFSVFDNEESEETIDYDAIKTLIQDIEKALSKGD